MALSFALQNALDSALCDYTSSQEIQTILVGGTSGLTGVPVASASQAALGAVTSAALTDSTGGAASTTLAAISDTATKNAVASLAAQHAAVAADLLATRTLLTAIRTALVSSGIIKGSA